MTIEIKEKLTGSILDIGGGGEAVIGQIYKDRVTAIDNCKEDSCRSNTVLLQATAGSSIA